MTYAHDSKKTSQSWAVRTMLISGTRLQTVLEVLRFECRSQKVSLYSLGIDLARQSLVLVLVPLNIFGLLLRLNFMVLILVLNCRNKPSRVTCLQQFYLTLFDEWWQYFLNFIYKS